jgi:hypothetical protein
MSHMTIKTDDAPVRTPPSRILRQWQVTLCERDMIPGGDPRQAAVRSVRWEEAAGAQDDESRAWLAIDWAVHTLAPAWLDAAGLGDAADALRSLPPVNSPKSASHAHNTLEPVVSAARQAADTEGDAVREARQHSRNAMIEAEHAAYAGDHVIGRRCAGQLVELAAREGIPNRAGSAVVASALLAARSAAQAVTWRCLAKDTNVQDTYQPIIDAVQTSAVELYAAMGSIR